MGINTRLITRLLGLLMLLTLPTIAFAQNTFEANGVVKDENNEPAIGATVIVVGSNNGVYTGIDGDFKIKVKKGDKLKVVFVGYQTLEYVAKKNMQIKLKPNESVSLDDVVVVGYMAKKIANTSASVVKVKGGELANKPVANPLDAIQGKVSGLQIASVSGEPSADLEVKLHGQGSFRGVSAPLVIIDGMPSSLRNLRAMNPNDIADIQFLKDAAATSIYGSRAANGVIYITTKKGSSEKGADITIRSQYGVSTLANTDYFEQLMTGEELKKYYIETGIYKAKDLLFAKKGNASLENRYFQGNDFSWYKYIYQPASTYSADISLSGGTSKLNYYLSGGVYSQDGLKAGSGYKKAFGRMNLNAKITEHLSLGLNSSVSYDISQTSPFSGKNRSGGGLAVLNSPYVSPFDPTTGEEMDYDMVYNLVSPKHMIESNPFSQEEAIISNNGTLTYKPLPNLIFRSLVGVELNYKDVVSRSLPSFKAGNGQGSATRASGRVITLSTTNTASYMKRIDKHDLTFLVGQEYLNIAGVGVSASGGGLENDRLFMLNHVTKDKVISEELSSFATLSYFTQASYSYNSRYFLDLVLRNDRTSAFSEENRSGIFWSVGLLWKLKNELFLKKTAWLNTLDLKASYGTQGQPVTSNQNNFYVGSNGQKGGSLGVGLRTFGNPHLTWENQDKLTVGVKAGLWNMLDINLEYYRRVTSDMHFNRPVTSSKGITSRLENVGRYMNHGIDLQMQLTIFNKKDYMLATYLNFNYNRDKMLELFDGEDRYFEGMTGYIKGQPLTYILPIYKGVNTNTGEPEWYKPAKDITQTRKDDNAVANEYSAKLEQNTGVMMTVPVSGGWGLNARWKQFYMNADFSYAIGKYTLSMDKAEFENDFRIRNKEGNWNGSRNLFDYWKKVGDKTEFPSLAYVRSKNHKSTYVDTKMLENASFMRLKNLTIGYRIPTKKLGRFTMFKAAKVYFSGRNLLTITKFRGSDPEIPTPSLGANPNTKQFSFGVEFKF